MTSETQGVPPQQLADDDLRRHVEHLHATRHEVVLNGSQDAYDAHTQRMLALEQEFFRRFPEEAAPGARRTRAGSRDEAGQEVPGRDVSAP
jgi:hypothetical protein